MMSGAEVQADQRLFVAEIEPAIRQCGEGSNGCRENLRSRQRPEPVGGRRRQNQLTRLAQDE